MTAVCETRNHDHAKQLQEVLKSKYKNVKIMDSKLPCICINKEKASQ